MLEFAAPHIPAELFSFCIAAIPGPLIGALAFCCTPALALTLFHIEPNASPPALAATGFAVGFPSVAIVVPDVYEGCDPDAAEGVLPENGVLWPVGVALISARTDVK